MKELCGKYAQLMLCFNLSLDLTNTCAKLFLYVSVVVSCIILCAISCMQEPQKIPLGEPYYTDRFSGRKSKRDGSLSPYFTTGFSEDSSI